MLKNGNLREDILKCGICLEEISAEVGVFSCSTTRDIYCHICIIKSLQISYYNLGTLKCPGLGCENDISPDKFRDIGNLLVDLVRNREEFSERIFGEKTFTEFRVWIDNIYNQKIANDPKFCKCPKCSEVYTKSSERQQYCLSDTCSLRQEVSNGFCNECGEIYHFYGECSEMEEINKRWNYLKEEDKNNDEWILNNCFLCPRCHIITNKIAGCDFMVCGRDADSKKINIRGGCGHKYKASEAPRITRKFLAEETLKYSLPRNLRLDVTFTDNGVISHCNGCEEIIQSIRFQCVNCVSYNLCKNCYHCFASTEHPIEHIFKVDYTTDNVHIQINIDRPDIQNVENRTPPCKYVVLLMCIFVFLFGILYYSLN